MQRKRFPQNDFCTPLYPRFTASGVWYRAEFTGPIAVN
jgi:hypothetical protein